MKFQLPVTQGLCSISTDAPLFGSPSASVVATNGTEFYYQTMVTDNGTFCSFQYGLWTCLKDVPEEYVSFKQVLGNSYKSFQESLEGMNVSLKQSQFEILMFIFQYISFSQVDIVIL